MVFEDGARALEPLGFTPRQARFLAVVALHSGYCLRRQYAAFAGIRGKNVGGFLESLVVRGFAERFAIRADRGHVYHLHARTLYRYLRQEDNRNRRQASAALVARKIMLLDYVLTRGDVEWAATEADKVELFVGRLGVPKGALPQHSYSAAKPGGASTTRFFPHKLPIAIAGEPPTAQFVFLATEPSARAFEAFLQDHTALFRHLLDWTVVAVAPPGLPALPICESAFARLVARPTDSLARRSDELRWYFGTRRAVDANNFARLSVADINRFRMLRNRFVEPEFDLLYQRWLRHGDAVLAPADVAVSPPVSGTGRLVTEVLRFDYSLFGSLPGVA